MFDNHVHLLLRTGSTPIPVFVRRLLSGYPVGSIVNTNVTDSFFRIATNGQHGKYGTVSPVPSGASQVYFRPDSAPPLPKTLLISWVTNDSISHAREITPATKSSHDPKANAMVFEIHPGDLVNIYREVFSYGRS
jgi:hypothetical protein